MALPQLLTNTFIGGNVLKSIGIQDKNNAADIPPSEDTEFGYYIQDKNDYTMGGFDFLQRKSHNNDKLVQMFSKNSQGQYHTLSVQTNEDGTGNAASSCQFTVHDKITIQNNSTSGMFSILSDGNFKLEKSDGSRAQLDAVVPTALESTHAVNCTNAENANTLDYYHLVWQYADWLFPAFSNGTTEIPLQRRLILGANKIVAGFNSNLQALQGGTWMIFYIRQRVDGSSTIDAGWWLQNNSNITIASGGSIICTTGEADIAFGLCFRIY